MEEKALKNIFQNPPKEYRGKPFWSWNGKLEEAEVRRQIHVLKEMGMGGYFCHSRTGLATEYLGEEWFRLVRASAQEGEALDMETWLYDEDRWPSGTAGGMVTRDPQYRLHYLRLTVVPPTQNTSEFRDGFIWDDTVIAVFQANVEGLTFTTKTEISRKTTLPALADHCLLLFTVEEMASSDFYNGFTYLDTMNEEAVARFMELTHEKYAARCGDGFGKNIYGIFTDEPHHGAVMCSGGIPNRDSAWITPYPMDLFLQFEKRFGYDLKPYLPELFLQYEGRKVSQVKWHYMELLQQLFLERFFKPVDAWCREHHLKFTGHVLHEDSLTAQAVMTGSVMRVYAEMECPGVDVLTEHNRNYWIVKQLTSAARQFDKKQLLSELYGCTGWQMNFQSHKAVGDWQALLGINVRCHHLSWYSMKGEAKRDYPASISYQSAWYQEYAYVEDYFSRLHVFGEQGTPVCHLLVLNPVESTWTMIHPGWAHWLDASAPEIRQLQDRYADTFHWLMGAQVDFDYGDEALLKEHGSVVLQGDGTPLLKVGKAVYKQVLITGMATIRSSTLALLKQFIQAGGSVVYAGEKPKYIDALPSEDTCLEGAETIAFTETALRNRFAPLAYATVTDGTGNPLPEIYVQGKEKRNEVYLFFLNTNRDTDFAQVRISFRDSGRIDQWNPRNGSVTPLGDLAAGDTLEISLAPGQEFLCVLKKQAIARTDLVEENWATVEEMKLPQRFSYTLSEPNVCVLDMARWSVNGEQWQAEQEILKVDRVIRSRFNIPWRGGEMVQPWYRQKTEESAVCRVALAFSFHVETLPEGALQLAMETPEVFQVTVNGSHLPSVNHTGWWVDHTIRTLDLPVEMLQIGKNVICLEGDFYPGTDLEAIYLLGNFGVELDGIVKTLTTLPQQLAAGDVRTQGLPFYGAGIKYQVQVPTVTDGQRAKLRLDGFDGACVKIESKVIAFAPYEVEVTHLAGKEVTLEYMLTRRNTFGPLHEAPALVGGYGPGNFVTEGEHFYAEQYGLLPQGMTGKVGFCIEEKEK